MAREKNKKQKIVISVVLSLFLLSNFIFVFSAKAQGYPVFDNAQFTQNQLFHTGEQADKIKEKAEQNVSEQLWKTMVLTASVALRNVALYLAKSAAESAVEMIATGDWGKGPLFETEGWGEMLKNEYEYAAGNVLEFISEGIYASLGFDICAPKLDFKIWLTASLGEAHDLMHQTTPYCAPTKVLENWDGFVDEWEGKFKDGEAASLTALDTVALAFAPTASPFGLFLTFNDQILLEATKAQNAREQERKEGEGYKAIKNQLGTRIAAPISVSRGMAERDIVRSEEFQDQSYVVAAEVATSIPEQMLSTFVNTLMSRGILEAIRKAILRGFASSSQSYNPKEKIYETEKGTEKAILALKTVDIAYTYKEINLLEEFNICPDVSAGGENIPNINHCVISEKFYNAVSQSANGKALTVQEAIEFGYLDGNLPLIGAGDERNLQRRCFEQGYCYGNLVKLRKARIVPVGWEMAASLSETQQAPVTLGQAVQSFYDSKSAYYHLVDPNWLLVAPLQRCRVQGYNEMLFAKGGGERQEVCVDTQDCIRTDDNGKCVGGWGYCSAEENVWNLNGESCPGYYDSCLRLVRSDGKQFDYLKNTLQEDSLLCNEQNVGCRWYSTWKYGANWADNKDYKLLANAKLTQETCSPGDAGCSAFYGTKAGIGANLLPNGDFEYVDAVDPAVVPNWNISSLNNVVGAKISFDEENVFSGSKSLKVVVPAGKSIKGVALKAGAISIAPQPIPRFFAFSAYVNVLGTIQGSWALQAQSAGQYKIPIVLCGNPADCNPQGGFASLKTLLEDSQWSDATTKNQWVRRSFVVEVKPYVGEVNFVIMSPVEPTAEIVFYVDSAMVEEIDPLSQGYNVSDFSSYGNVAPTRLKKAPDYLKCYNMADDQNNEILGAIGTAYSRKNIKVGDDSALCQNYAKSCAADEVGCEEFTNKETGETVFGVPSYYDYCPDTCAGYAVFEQSATNFETGFFPFYMIPKNAESCGYSDVGCDEFTNLDVVAKGGEGREYYSELRMCRKPVPDMKGDDKCAPFYTWTGSDTSGYQLISYDLQDANKDGSPDTTQEDSALCNQAVYNVNLAAQKISDCREFYDKNGKKTYHLYTKTITCSDDCHPYRRTLATQNDCVVTGGSWENNACIYMAIPKEGKTCSASGAGCREFKGSNAGNVQSVFKSTFEQQPKGTEKSGEAICAAGTSYVVEKAKGATSTLIGISWNSNNQTCNVKDGVTVLDVPFSELCAWRGFSWENGKCWEADTLLVGFTDWNGGTVSTESLYSGGHSLLLDTNVKSTETDITDRVYSGVNYRLSWWAKKNVADAAPVSVKLVVDGAETVAETVTLWKNEVGNPNGDWNFYNIKQFNVPEGAKKVLLKIEKAFDGKLYLDDVKLYTAVDTYYLLKQTATGTVPEMCNQKLDGAILPQAMIGCSQYEDSNKGTHFLKSFTKLCSPVAVSCEALINTSNSDSPFVEKFSQGTPLKEEVTQANLQNLCETDAGIFNKLKSKYSNLTKLYWCVEQNSVLGRCESKQCGAPGSGFAYTSKDLCSLAGNAWVDNKCWKGSTLTVAADQLIYLVNEKSYQCVKDAEGCTALGAPNLQSNGAVKPITDKTKCDKAGGAWNAAAGICFTDASYNVPAPSWNEVYYIVDPDEFKDKLCQYSGAGCDKFTTSEQGKSYYLFDPSERVCEYKAVEQTADDGTVSSISGWWKKYDKTADGLPIKCESKDYYSDGTQNLLRSVDVNFSGWAGACQSKYDKCTAFVDPSDKLLSNIGRPYYYLNNDNLDKKTCGNGVSQFKGCALFNDTSNPNLTWASAATYVESKAQGGAKVNPEMATTKKYDDKDLCAAYTQCFSGQKVGAENQDISADLVVDVLYEEFYAKGTVGGDDFKKIAKNCSKFESDFERRQCFCTAEITLAEKVCNVGQVLNEIAKENQAPDSNVILNVQRDRRCKEWYTCAGGHWDWVAQRQQYEKKCDVLGLCRQLIDGTEICSDLDIYDNNYDYSSVGVFNKNEYVKRNTDFNGIDYSGYTIPGMYPLHALKSVNANASVAKDAPKIARLAFVGPSCSATKPCPTGYYCGGDKVCIKNIDGTTPTCRAFPEAESPFPGSVLTLDGSEGVKADFAGAKICLGKEDCGCNYEKITYGNKSKDIYIQGKQDGKVTPTKPENICENDYNGYAVTCETACVSFNKNSKACDAKKDGKFTYADNGADIKVADPAAAMSICGQCLKRDNDANVYKGWDGYCVEKDSSNIVYGKKDNHPCLSWYPVDVVGGTVDLNNYLESAGYVPASENGDYYCVEPALFKYQTAWTPDQVIDMWKSIEAGDEDCNCAKQNYFEFFGLLKSAMGEGETAVSLFDKNFEKALWDKIQPTDDNPVSTTKYWGSGSECLKGSPVNAWSERARCMYEYLHQDYVEDPAKVKSKATDTNDSEVCPAGYFPTFGPCGDNKNANGYSYGSSGGGCGFMCVPYGSKLYITEQRMQDFGDTGEDMKKELLALAKEYNGKECFPGLYFKDNFTTAPGDATEQNLIDSVVSATAGNGGKRTNFFSILFVPYKYCQGAGVAVENGEYDYMGTSAEKSVGDYMDSYKALSEFSWAAQYADKVKPGLDYGFGCSAVAAVTEQGTNEPLAQAKAWTDRLWLDKNWSFNKDLPAVGNNFAFWNATYSAPFGRLNLKEALADGDDIQVAYCATANKLSLPFGYDENGMMKCSGQIYTTDATTANLLLDGKSYGNIVASAPKAITCSKNQDCYVYAEGEVDLVSEYGGNCVKKEIEDAPACEEVDGEMNAKAYWLWRDGCFNVTDPVTTSANCLSGNQTVDNYNSGYSAGSYVSFVSFANDKFEYWRENKEAYDSNGNPIAGVQKYVKITPFNGNCGEYQLCRFEASVNRNILECDTPDNWKNKQMDALNKDAKNTTFLPGLGCKKGKTPLDQGNECELGSHVIVCADNVTAKIDSGKPKIKEAGPDLVKGKKIKGETYISTQNILEWIGDEVGGMDPNAAYSYCGTQTKELVREYSFGKCVGGQDAVCARNSDCDIFECKENKCTLKDFAGAGVDVKTIEGYGVALAEKPSFKDRLSNLFQQVYKLYNWNIDPIKLSAYMIPGTEDSPSPVEVKDTLVDISEKVKWDNAPGVDFSSDLNKSKTVPPKVAGHIKTDGGTNVALLGTVAIQTNIGTFLQGDVIGRGGSLGAQMEFYAWADKNHMPLRQVMVDFGNNQDIIGANSDIQRYKNHKPMCGGETGKIGECVGYEGLVCASNQDCELATDYKSTQCAPVISFGNSSGACMEGYFSYFGMYQCKKKQMTTLQVCSGGAATPDESAEFIAKYPFRSDGCWDPAYKDEFGNQVGACVYFPRVQVKDNWGWCNGKCAGQSAVGCFEDKCDYVYPKNPNDGLNPWTYFNGKVIVMP